MHSFICCVRQEKNTLKRFCLKKNYVFVVGVFLQNVFLVYCFRHFYAFIFCLHLFFLLLFTFSSFVFFSYSLFCLVFLSSLFTVCFYFFLFFICRITIYLSYSQSYLLSPSIWLLFVDFLLLTVFVFFCVSQQNWQNKVLPYRWV